MQNYILTPNSNSKIISRINILLIHSILLIALLFCDILISCTSLSSLRKEYLQKISIGTSVLAHKTYFVFLIDGLGYLNFIDYQKNMVNTSAYFQPKPTVNFFPALSVVPSLTFPNIVSLLTGKKIFEHQVIGNKMLISENGEVEKIVNWEDPLPAMSLNQKIGSMMIFNHLAEGRRNNISLAYYFNEGSTAHIHKDLYLVKQYLDEDYIKIDRQTLYSLEKFMIEVPRNNWPEFVFVHLVSFDFASHLIGPNSTYVQKNLNMLDLQLGRIYNLLLATEKKFGNVVTLMTSDHGFVDTPNYFDINQFVTNIENRVQVLAQSRVASLYFNKALSDNDITQTIKRVSHERQVGLITQKSLNGFNLIIDGIYYSFQFKDELCKSDIYTLVFRGNSFCPQDSQQYFRVQGSPKQLVEQISAYYRSLDSADVLLFAAEGVNFEPKQKGGHGGVSLYEMQPLVLLRNAKLDMPTDAFHIESLLDFISNGSQM